jgi:hypothetical protein
VPVSPSAPAPAPAPPRRAGGPTIRAPFVLAACGLLIAAVALLLFVLPGGSGGGGPLSPIAEAAEHTASVPGARFSGTGSGSFGGGSLQMQFDGAFNGQTGRSQMQMQMQATGPQPISTSISAVQDGSVVYMNSPLFAGQLPNGASWMKLDFSGLAGAAALSAQSTGDLDARQMLQQLQSVAPGAQVVGTERVRGVRTTRYSGTIDPQLEADELRDAGNDEAAALVEASGSPTVDVWVDRRHLVRRMSMTIPVGIPGQPPAQMAMTFDVYDFGAAPAIDLPPSGDVYDATELTKGILDGESG